MNDQEKAIYLALIAALYAAGFHETSRSEGSLFDGDTSTIRFASAYGPAGGILLIPGNGADILSDWAWKDSAFDACLNSFLDTLG